MLISQYTWCNELRYSAEDAMKYLYFNGSIPLKSSRSEYALRVSKTTICNHLRLMHLLSWGRSDRAFRLILYCISDSKAIVQYLRFAKQDPNFDAEWWKQEKTILSNPYKGGEDELFFSSNIGFKCKDISKSDLISAQKYINSSINMPKIYHAYKALFNIFSKWDDRNCRDDLCILTLECIHLRSRLDNRVIRWEQ